MNAENSKYCIIRGSKTNRIQKFAFENAEFCIKELEKDSKIYGLTRGQFSLIDLILAILQKIGKANIITCTWSAGIKDAKQMKLIKDSGLINSFKIITDHSYSTRQKQYAITLEELFGVENIATSEIHAKFTLIENEDWKVVINTSMNLNANRTCENFEVSESIELYDFYKGFASDIFKSMPKGFTESSVIVNNALNGIFGAKKEIIKEREINYVW